jgi:hypothetical protein
MEKWEKFKILSTAFATIIIPILLGYIGHVYTEALKERELQGRFVELGVSILQQTPNSTSKGLRSWAIAVLNRYSGVPIDEVTKKELLEEISIPTQSDIQNRQYISQGGQELLIDNARFRLSSCDKNGTIITCSISFFPDQSTDRIDIFGLSMNDHPFYQSIISIDDQELKFYNFPVRKAFKVIPAVENSLRVKMYWPESEPYKSQKISFPLGFNLGKGKFDIIFVDVPLKMISEN